MLRHNLEQVLQWQDRVNVDDESSCCCDKQSSVKGNNTSDCARSVCRMCGEVENSVMVLPAGICTCAAPELQKYMLA